MAGLISRLAVEARPERRPWSPAARAFLWLDRSRAWAWLPAPAVVLWIVASGIGCLALPGGADVWGDTVAEAGQCLGFLLMISLPLPLLALMLLMLWWSAPRVTPGVRGCDRHPPGNRRIRTDVVQCGPQDLKSVNARPSTAAISGLLVAVNSLLIIVPGAWLGQPRAKQQFIFRME